MKVVITALSLLCLAPTAFAARHIHARGMSCDRLQRTVHAEGAVILHYGAGLYDRVVAHGGYCLHGETTKPFFLGQCFTGYTCENIDSGGGE